MREQSVPVVRLEVDYMKHAIIHAFTEYSARIDQDVQAAVERFCEPKNISAIVGRAVEDTLKTAINEEIDRFYRYGAGRDFLRAQVEKKLASGGTY